ncbi:hypothetical protein QTP70_029091 [Hemibagrus guttatus]|uniref:Uncharacterized protein n=1 Tax=Hemibagrus guttatus TaxID=175788 RepID=A0AAE0PRG1_9TELE|nr:hypothetical protein QTP70_029091 [Hemibagrus guttatus]KAK3522738.1 hypothetical protein QTP86_030782 [Hemibagrus guttatus]
MTITGICFWRSTIRARTTGLFWRGQSTYTQGQNPEPRIREYFYYLDHQGQLFLDDTKVKNFVTCFKDQQFLVFFFKHLKVNRSGRYQQHFPYISLCGRERNFLRFDDQPVVFTHLLSETGHLSYCGGGTKLTFPFQPHSLFMHPDSGRVYHPAPEHVGGVGLVRSALAIEFSPHFQYSSGQDSSSQPTHFQWDGQWHTLTNELLRHFAVN